MDDTALHATARNCFKGPKDAKVGGRGHRVLAAPSSESLLRSAPAPSFSLTLSLIMRAHLEISNRVTESEESRTVQQRAALALVHYGSRPVLLMVHAD